MNSRDDQHRSAKSLQFVQGASVAAGAFSKWPETLGFAAIGDAALTREFADIACQEYHAVGIEEALSPQIDLATEPRWGRINGTFGEDGQTAKAMAEASVAGFQNGEAGINSGSVIAVAKHWVGYGAAKDGWDSHNAWAACGLGRPELREAPRSLRERIRGKSRWHHADLFDPRWRRVRGKPIEAVAAGDNKQLLTGLLRGRFDFDGVIISDWLITNDCEGAASTARSRA